MMFVPAPAANAPRLSVFCRATGDRDDGFVAVRRLRDEFRCAFDRSMETTHADRGGINLDTPASTAFLWFQPSKSIIGGRLYASQ
ncbi:MAG: hypothetical protein ABI443_05620 [Chthoniobacterales bacterium]